MVDSISRSRLLRVSDVLPPTSILVAIRCMATFRLRGLSVVRIWKKRDRPVDWADQIRVVAKMSRSRIIPCSRWPAGDAARRRLETAIEPVGKQHAHHDCTGNGRFRHLAFTDRCTNRSLTKATRVRQL